MRNVGSAWRPDERLYVAGRDRTKLALGVLGQIEAVRKALGDEWASVRIHGVLCFIGCEWTRTKPKDVNGVVALWPTLLPDHVTIPGPHSAQTDAIASYLRRVLRQAK